MNGHDVAHYAIAGALAAVGASGLLAEHNRIQAIDAKPPVAVYHAASSGGLSFAEAAPHPNRFAWPTLGEQKTIALGEALRDSGATAKVVLFCQDVHCKDLEADIDDAFQIAGWTDDEESTVMVKDDEQGFIVGPPGAKADALKGALAKAGLGPVTVAPMNVRNFDVGLIIARRPK